MKSVLDERTSALRGLLCHPPLANLGPKWPGARLRVTGPTNAARYPRATGSRGLRVGEWSITLTCASSCENCPRRPATRLRSRGIARELRSDTPPTRTTPRPTVAGNALTPPRDASYQPENCLVDGEYQARRVRSRRVSAAVVLRRELTPVPRSDHGSKARGADRTRRKHLKFCCWHHVHQWRRS